MKMMSRPADPAFGLISLQTLVQAYMFRPGRRKDVKTLTVKSGMTGRV